MSNKQIEMIDIFDKEMNFVGTVEKGFAHKNKLWHKTAHVWVVNSNGEVLLQHRAKCKKVYGDLWDETAGGHVDAGETPLLALKREFEEELGVKWTFGDIKESYIIPIKKMGDRKILNEFQYVYFIKANINVEKINKQVEEVADIKYLNFEEFLKLYNNDKFIPTTKESKKRVINCLKNLIK